MTEQIILPQIIIWCNRSENCLGVSADLFIIIVIWWVLPDVLWFLLIRKLWHPFGKLGSVSKGFSLLWSLCFMWTWDHALSPALILWYQIPWSVWSSLQSSLMIDTCLEALPEFFGNPRVFGGRDQGVYGIPLHLWVVDGVSHQPRVAGV